MKYLKYVYEDIKNNVIIYMLFMVEISLAFIIFYNSIEMIDIQIKNQKKIEKINNNSSYILEDTMQIEKIDNLLNNDNNNEIYNNYRKIFEYINNKKLDRYVCYGYDDLEKESGLNKSILYVSENFFDIFNIKNISGRKFDNMDYTYTSKEKVPIIIGYNLKSRYKVGDELEFYDVNYNKSVGEIVGILKPGSYFEKISFISYEYMLDNVILVPYNEAQFIDNDSAALLYSILTSEIFMTDNKNEMDQLIDYTNKLVNCKFKYVQTRKKTKESIEIIKNKIKDKINIFLIITFFALVALISSIEIMIKRNIKEYFIHILCGAYKLDIVYRIFFQVLIVIICSFIPVIYIKHFTIYTLLTLIVGSALGVVITLICIKDIRYEKIMKEIKDNE